MNRLYSFILAVALLTRLPIPNRLFPLDVTDKIKSGSVIFYPVVGALIGCFLALILWALPDLTPTFLAASILLCTWVFLTGALHLDGLADATDAAFASHKDIARTMAVFKDPHAGPMASVSITLALILKFSLLVSLIELPNDKVLLGEEWSWVKLTADLFSGGGTNVAMALIFSTVWARLLAVVYMATTPYASSQGMASGIQLVESRAEIVIMAFAVILLSLCCLSTLTVIIVVFTLVAWCFAWRRFWLSRIGGYTGDCVGALIEIAEILALLVIVLMAV